ncbi:MAG: PA14 domain-containing protein [Planctomycetota bacterium]
MSRKCLALTSFLLVLGLVGSTSAELVGQWKLDEGGGTTAIDATGNGNDGTLEGDPTVVNGEFGQALAFDDSRVVISASDSLTADFFQGTFTLSAWINPKRTGNTWQQVFRSVAASYTNDTLFLNNDGRLSWRGTVNGGWAGGMCETAPDVVPADQWTHVAVTGDGANFRIYVNGELSQESAFQTTDGANTTYYIGGTSGGESYTGQVDDMRIYDHVLSEDDVRASMENQGGAIVKAYGADPASGSLIEDTWVTLTWRAGDFAVSHDVYLSDSLDDVTAGAEAAFQGNQPTAMLIVGFAGFPYPDGLVPGTTYYWRIDEVNPDEPNSPWTGDIWSFLIPPKTGYNPSPADGSKFIATDDVTLSWTPGFGAKLHTVYFGDNFDEVDAAAGGLPQAVATFSAPSPLEPDKTYYWRVDEFDVAATHKGPVWSFSTGREGGGVKGQYFQGMTPSGNAVLTRTDPQIDFSWGSGGPDPSVGDDNFSARWTGEVEAVFTETYTFYTNSDDGVRLWVDGKQLVDNWTDHGPTENRGTIDLVAGQTYSLVMEFYENGGGAVAELRWSSPSTPKQLIPQAALSFLVHAHGANPANGTVGVKHVSNLTWSPGEFAASHEVYFGTDADAVANATKASPEYKGGKALGDESLDPGMLSWDTTYYWRVDEVNATNPDSPWVGNVWSFNTGDFLVVDDFEAYNDIDPPDPASHRIFDNWIDGFGTTTNGALVGNDLPPYAEQTVVHGGACH